MRTSASLALAALVSLAVPLAAHGQTQPDALDKIAAYAGTWHTTIVRYQTAYSKAGSESTTLRNDCWRSAGYYACDQFVDGPSVALIVFRYDAKNDLYKIVAIPADGDASNGGTLHIAGDTWTFPWEQQDGGKTVYFHVVNVFHGPNAIEYRQEFSPDNVHWTVSATGHEERVP